jgi:hypothetical protein
MKAITRYEAIELIIPILAPGTRFNFLDKPQLRSDVTKDIIVQGIKAFSVVEKPLTFNGNPTASVAQMQASELTLYVDGEESIFRIPLTELMNSQNFAATFFSQQFPDEFDNLMIDWTKSYITTPAPYANAAAFAFLFGISYKRYAPGAMAKIKAAKGDSSNQPGLIMA